MSVYLACNDDFRQGLWDALDIPETSELTAMNPYENIYGVYKEEYKHLYRKWDQQALSLTSEIDDLQSSQQIIKNPLAIPSDITDEGDKDTKILQLSQLFRGVDRLKLMNLIINTKAPGCCGIDMTRLLQDRCIKAYSPLHDALELRVVTIHFHLLPLQETMFFQ